MKGRPQKLNELKKLTGTYRKDADLNQAEYKELLNIDPPDLLPEGAQVVWSRIVPQIIETGAVREIDATALSLLCVSLDMYNYCTEQIEDMKARGEMKDDVEHAKHMRVLYVSRREAFSQSFKLMQDFGLTPLTRQKLIIKSKEDDIDDPLDL